MKTKSSFFILFLLSLITAHAQTRSDVFKKDVEVTWLGLDFTKAKFLGDRERLGSESDIHRLIDSWNSLILIESNKYDIAKAIDRAKVTNATEIVNANNAELDVLAMYSDAQRDYLRLKPTDIEEIVAGYDFGNVSGIALMFVVESFSKLNMEASIWVTFINTNTKEVLFTEHMMAAPKGFGMRNFWAGAIYGILEKMNKKEFEMWRKKHYRP